jgi:hypothetical protein
LTRDKHLSRQRSTAERQNEKKKLIGSLRGSSQALIPRQMRGVFIR